MTKTSMPMVFAAMMLGLASGCAAQTDPQPASEESTASTSEALAPCRESCNPQGILRAICDARCDAYTQACMNDCTSIPAGGTQRDDCYEGCTSSGDACALSCFYAYPM